MPLVDEGIVRSAEAFEGVEHPLQLDSEVLVVETETDEEKGARRQQMTQRLERRLMGGLSFGRRGIERAVSVGRQDELRRVVDAAVEVPDGGSSSLAAPEVFGLFCGGVDVPGLEVVAPLCGTGPLEHLVIVGGDDEAAPEAPHRSRELQAPVGDPG